MGQTNPRRAGRKEVTTRMLPELADAVREAARAHGMTVNEFIVETVEARLRRQGGDEHLVAMLDHARVRQALLIALDELLPPEPAEQARAS
jgi:uncharacterized protein (DUF1778 family)